jgi:hypothetical protein
VSDGFPAIGQAVRRMVAAQKSQGPRGACVGGCGAPWEACEIFKLRAGAIGCCPDCQHPMIEEVSNEC